METIFIPYWNGSRDQLVSFLSSKLSQIERYMMTETAACVDQKRNSAPGQFMLLFLFMDMRMKTRENVVNWTSGDRYSTGYTPLGDMDSLLAGLITLINDLINSLNERRMRMKQKSCLRIETSVHGILSRLLLLFQYINEKGDIIQMNMHGIQVRMVSWKQDVKSGLSVSHVSVWFQNGVGQMLSMKWMSMVGGQSRRSEFEAKSGSRKDDEILGSCCQCSDCHQAVIAPSFTCCSEIQWSLRLMIGRLVNRDWLVGDSSVDPIHDWDSIVSIADIGTRNTQESCSYTWSIWQWHLLLDFTISILLFSFLFS